MAKRWKQTLLRLTEQEVDREIQEIEDALRIEQLYGNLARLINKEDDNYDY